MDSERLARMFEVLQDISARGPRTLTQIAKDLSIPTSSAHDLLKAMAQANILQNSGRGYDLGQRTYRLAFDVQDRFEIINLAGPLMENLAELVGFDVYLAVRTGHQVMYAAKFHGRSEVKVEIPLGRPLYRHATSAGKLFAAFDADIRQSVLDNPKVQLTARTLTDNAMLMRDLSNIRKKSLSFSNEEAVEGIIGIATPIMNSDGRIIAAAHISALKGALEPERMNLVCAELGKTTSHIQSLLARRVSA